MCIPGEIKFRCLLVIYVDLNGYALRNTPFEMGKYHHNILLSS